MNNGYRIVREDTYTKTKYDEDGYECEFNLEYYISNMNIIRWHHQAIYCRRAIMSLCGESYWD